MNLPWRKPRQSAPSHPAVTDPVAWGEAVANRIVTAAFAPHEVLRDWSRAESEAFDEIVAGVE